MALPQLSAVENAQLRSAISTAIRKTFASRPGRCFFEPLHAATCPALTRRCLDRKATAIDVGHIAAEVREVAALAIAAELFDINQSESRLCSLPDEVISLVAAHMSFNNLLTACQICSRWRTALLSDARLWDHITLRLHDHQLRDSTWMSESLDELLARSRELPVSISITDRDNPEDADDNDAPLAAPFIDIKHSHRSRSLSLCFLNHGLDVGGLTQPAPLLETLTLNAVRIRFYLQRLPDRLFTGTAPCLTVVSLRGFGLPKGPLELPSVRHLQLAGVPNLDGDQTRSYSISRIAEVFPNLTRLVLGQELIPFSSAELDKARGWRGFTELMVYDKELRLLRERKEGFQIDRVPRLILGIWSFRVVQQLTPSLITMHIYDNSFEGVSPCGRVVNVTDSATMSIFLSRLATLRHVVIDCNKLCSSDIELHAPVLESLEVQFRRTSREAFRCVLALDDGREPEDSRPSRLWSLPVLKHLRLRFVEDARGRGVRAIQANALVNLVTQYFAIGPPRLKLLDLVNLRILARDQRGAESVLGIAEEILYDGAAIDPQSTSDDNLQPLVPPPSQKRKPRGWIKSKSSTPSSPVITEDLHTSNVERAESGADSGASKSSSDEDADGGDNRSRTPDSMSQTGEGSESWTDEENVAEESRSTIEGDWRLLTSDFPAVAFRDLFVNT